MKILNKTAEYLFYLFVFFLPWQTRLIWRQGYLNGDQWEYGTFSLYGTEILLLIILFLGIIIFSLRKKEEAKNGGAINFLCLYASVLLLFLAGAISIFFALDGMIARYAFIRLVEGIALFWLAINLEFRFNKICLAFVLGALGQALLAIYEFFAQSVFASKWLGMAGQSPSELGGASVIETFFGRWLRSYGGLPHPNILAGYLVLGLILLLTLVFVSRRGFGRAAYYSFFPIIIAGLFFSFSREAWFGFFLGLVFLSWVIFRSRTAETKTAFLNLLIVAVTVAGLFVIFFEEPFMTRLRGENRLEVKSLETRIESYDRSFIVLRDHWLWGVGIGNYTLALKEFINPNLRAWDYEPVHNVFLLVIAELGLMGFVALVILLSGIIGGINYFRGNNEREIVVRAFSLKIAESVSFGKKFDYYFVGFTTALISLGAISLFDHYFWTLYFGIMIFWLFFGLWVKNLKGEKYSYS